GSAPAVTSPAGGVPPRLVVSENPANWTPHVLDGRVDTITQIGHKIFVGGRFGKVREAGGKDTLTRKNIFAFDARTGAIDKSFDPAAKGAVNAIVPAPGGNAIFVGGQFSKIAGKSQPALAKLDLSGKLVSGFRPAVES